MSGHKHCCKARKRPTTPGQFAALVYPSNLHHKDNENRIHNPLEVGVKYPPPPPPATTRESRRGWWFELAPSTSGPPLLDGSGDGESRGCIYSSDGVVPSDRKYRLVCLNAASLKMLPLKKGGKPQPCGFTWRASLLEPGKTAPPTGLTAGEQEALKSGSGWIPISDIDFKKKTVKEGVLAALRNWRCCTEKYRDWGAKLTRKGKRYRFRSTEEVRLEILSFTAHPERFAQYFKSFTAEARKMLTDSKGEKNALSASFGILSACESANKLTDYLPKGEDHKHGGYKEGYTNLCVNVSLGPTRPLMAPIALDIFPANHIFQRLEFKGKKRIWGYVFKVPPRKTPKAIGRVEWYYGYCNIKGGKEKDRRYGWVPALALKRA